MKLNRMRLRRLIESVLREEENPGSKFDSAVKRGEENKSEQEKQRATEELQKTYDWFVEVVFPAIENNKWPIVADDDYHTMRYPMFADDPKDRMRGMIPKGTKFSSLQDAPIKDPYPRKLSDLYARLEASVINEKLRVTMQSDQPEEFEKAVEAAKKDPKALASVRESLSRGSLYRRRYRRY